MGGGSFCTISVPASSEIESFEQFRDLVAANPGKYSISSTPSGSLWSNAVVYLKKKLGLDLKLVNYKGGGPATRAVLAGETDFGSTAFTPLLNFIKAGQLRCLVAWTEEDYKLGDVTVPSIARFSDDKILSSSGPRSSPAAAA